MSFFWSGGALPISCIHDGDDAVLAAEVAVAERLRVADGRRRGELALECGDERRRLRKRRAESDG